MRPFILCTFALVLPACGGGGADPASGPPPDLTEVLESGQSRAGKVVDEAALFGGISAEGRVGDYKIYNDRVQFVVQGMRDGDYYVQEGGGVIDADIIRPEGQPGRDVIDEWGTMFGIGQLTSPSSVTVLASGGYGGASAIRVEGVDVALGLLEGALDIQGFLPELGLNITTDFILPPDSWVMEVRTTVTATDTEASLMIGDMLMSGPEAVDPWSQGVGMGDIDANTRRWTGYVGSKNDLAVGILAASGQELSAGGPGAELLSGLAFLALGFGDEVTLAPGESHTHVRYYGVAPDLATLSDELQGLHGDNTEQLDGVVTASDGPVAGARVNVTVDGEPFTVAFTDSDGAWSALVPSGATTTAIASGRNRGIHLDLPDGAAHYGPYNAPSAAAISRGALRDGAPPVPWADGRGVADPSSPMTLGQPGSLVVQTADGGPMSIQVSFVGGDSVGSVDERLIPGRPHGLVAGGWSGDGEMTLPVEPGTYDVLVHRGMRFELYSEQVEVTAGASVTVTADLGQAISTPGWVLGDPHSHASPSGDGEITMEGRLLVTAGAGVQVHFGTDHDHMADYRPLVEDLGLSGTLASVVADEVSPPLRGHTNIYPITPLPELPNHGALPWWSVWAESTQHEFDLLRERHGGDFILQLNHPLDSGVAGYAGWEPGIIGKPENWSDDFQAIEACNSGSLDGLAVYFDLVPRGYRVSATSVTDSHAHFSGDPGVNGTWMGIGSNDVADFNDEALIEAFGADRLVASRGVFLSLSVDPGSTLTNAGTVDVRAVSPSWIQVDRLVLYKDGAPSETLDGSAGQFNLSPEADAIYNIVAEGDTSMQPLSGATPWAMSGAIRVDVGGDGWTPPLPPLQFD